ncbi:Aminopeptidase S [Phycisphaerales bacterium]|nr:Aminopeptidase S [Phycisphaerales bacterium]
MRRPRFGMVGDMAVEQSKAGGEAVGFSARGRAKFPTRMSTALKGLIGASPIPRFSTKMPGVSHAGPLPALTEDQRDLSAELRANVEELAGPLAGRNVFNPARLRACEEFLSARLGECGRPVTRQEFDCRGQTVANFQVEFPGAERPGEILVVGAHYDAVELSRGLCPAANDNGSGTAAVLALARRFARRGAACGRTVRFVLWVNEEPPFFWTDLMGSLVYARACRAKAENIVGMITPETLGCYSEVEGSQRYPLGLFKRWYPARGDFVAFLGMHEAAALVRRSVELFREHCRFPSIGVALPAIIPHVGASDHWSFWKCGYPALMVTDTAPYRYRWYHTEDDTPDKMNFECMARVVEGLASVVETLANDR